ncbi:MAG: hypothetical protein IJM62_08330, partial [Lachnospiraceae bacterium]|nr:hypothetical protein [Lachnospiraceae bacterium]
VKVTGGDIITDQACWGYRDSVPADDMQDNTTNITEHPVHIEEETETDPKETDPPAEKETEGPEPEETETKEPETKKKESKETESETVIPAGGGPVSSSGPASPGNSRRAGTVNVKTGDDSEPVLMLALCLMAAATAAAVIFLKYRKKGGER